MKHAVSYSILDLMKAACIAYEMPRELLFGPSKKWSETRPRQMFCYVAHDVFGLSSVQIGLRIGRDHATVLHAVWKVRALLQERDQGTRDLLARLKWITRHNAKRVRDSDIPAPKPVPPRDRYAIDEDMLWDLAVVKALPMRDVGALMGVGPTRCSRKLDQLGWRGHRAASIEGRVKKRRCLSCQREFHTTEAYRLCSQCREGDTYWEEAG